MLAKFLNRIFYRGQLNSYYRLKSHSHYSDLEKRNHQLKKVKSLLLTTKTIPYYSPFINKLDIVNLSYGEFCKIPFLTKDDIRKNLKNMVDPTYSEMSDVYENTSGGSTGEPVKFFQTKKCSKISFGSYHFANFLNGISPFDRTIVFWGALRDMHSGSKKTLYRKLIDYINITTTLNTFVLSPQIIKEYVDILNKKKPTFIKAYVHSMYEIAQYINDNNIPISFKPVIHTSTGPLYPEMKDEIQKAFNGARVFSFYGSREVGPIATEIPSTDDMIVLYDNVLVEIIDEDGNPVDYNQEGEIVVTTLNNPYMPLIRYKIGDRAIKGDGKDVFGTLQLKSVLGRTLGLIVKKNGQKIDGQFFTSLFFNKDGIKNFQLIQKSLDILFLYIVKNDNFNSGELQNIVDIISKEVDGIEVKVEFKDKIDLSKTGKMMYVYSEIL